MDYVDGYLLAVPVARREDYRALADMAADVFKDHGATPMFTIVGSGPNGAFPHHHTGDTVLNAVMDYVFMLAGYFLVMALPFRWGIVLMLGLEILSAAVARDSLILTTIRVIHPIPAIAAWQDATNPVTHPPGQ